MTAVSADGFAFTRSKTYPAALSDFEKSFSFLSAASCDILMTPHPGASDLWGRLAEREKSDPHALADRTACRRYADRARQGLRTRIEAERNQ